MAIRELLTSHDQTRLHANPFPYESDRDSRSNIFLDSDGLQRVRVTGKVQKVAHNVKWTAGVMDLRWAIGCVWRSGAVWRSSWKLAVDIGRQENWKTLNRALGPECRVLVNSSFNLYNNSFSITESINYKIHCDLFIRTHSVLCTVFEIQSVYTVKSNILMPYHTVIHVLVHLN
jgi:hypothetical protein